MEQKEVNTRKKGVLSEFNPIWIFTLMAGLAVKHGCEWIMVHDGGVWFSSQSSLSILALFLCVFIGIMIADFSLLILAYLVIFEFESTKKYFSGLIKRFRLRQLY